MCNQKTDLEEFCCKFAMFCYCSDLLGVSSTADTEAPLVFIDTAGLGIDELDTADEESKGNEGKIGEFCYTFQGLILAGGYGDP